MHFIITANTNLLSQGKADSLTFRANEVYLFASFKSSVAGGIKVFARVDRKSET